MLKNYKCYKAILLLSGMIYAAYCVLFSGNHCIELGQGRYLMAAVTPGVTRQAKSCLVPTRRRECARTNAPRE